MELDFYATKIWDAVKMSLPNKDQIKDARRAAIVAGVAMFFSFLAYYSFLFYWSFNQLSIFILICPFVFSFPLYIFFWGTIDLNAVSLALNYRFIANVYLLLISLPFIFTITILAVGIIMQRKKENARRLAWILGILVALATLTFSLTGIYPTFVKLKPPIFFGYLFLVTFSAAGVLIASSAILFPRRSLEKYNQEKEFMSWEERARGQNRPYYPGDTTVAVVLLLFIAIVLLIVCYGVPYAIEG